MMMKYEKMIYDQERSLYGIENSEITDCRFEGLADGESPLKETRNILVSGCYFDLRYPFWHVNRGTVKGCELTENCRAALWYDNDLEIDGCLMNGIKALRECDRIELKNCKINSKEFAWKVRGMKVKNVSLQSEYPFMDCTDVMISDLIMTGKYSFQYVINANISNSNLDTKDAFWHSRNVTVRDSVIKGEYLGWYSEGLRLINCKIIGTQPLCYCKGLVLENCTMEGCDFSFEKSEVHATVIGGIDSIKNPMSGSIVVDGKEML